VSKLQKVPTYYSLFHATQETARAPSWLKKRHKAVLHSAKVLAHIRHTRGSAVKWCGSVDAYTNAKTLDTCHSAWTVNWYVAM